jgi:hypothetical protein
MVVLSQTAGSRVVELVQQFASGESLIAVTDQLDLALFFGPTASLG